MTLSNKDEHRLHAAEGWLDLDDPVEALRELDEIDHLSRSHPVVLLLRCRVYLAAGRPDYTHTIASKLTEVLPDSPTTWFYLACACSRRGEMGNAKSALTTCFTAAARIDEENEWQDRAVNCRDLEAFYQSQVC